MDEWVVVPMSPAEARDLARAVRILNRLIDETGTATARNMYTLAEALEQARPVVAPGHPAPIADHRRGPIDRSCRQEAVD